MQLMRAEQLLCWNLLSATQMPFTENSCSKEKKIQTPTHNKNLCFFFFKSKWNFTHENTKDQPKRTKEWALAGLRSLQSFFVFVFALRNGDDNFKNRIKICPNFHAQNPPSFSHVPPLPFASIKSERQTHLVGFQRILSSLHWLAHRAITFLRQG